MKVISRIIPAALVFVLCACDNNSNKKTETTESDTMLQNTVTDAANSTENRKAEGTEFQNEREPLIVDWDANTVIGEGIIWRSKNNGESDWSAIRATNVFGFTEDVGVGEKVQIVPLRKELPVIKLAVTKTTKRDEMAPDIWYEVVLEQISKEHEAYWSINALPDVSPEYPSEFLVVYPPTNYCALLSGIQFGAKDLPTGTTNKTIKGALDFDGDKLPDALIAEFCCKDETKSRNSGCDYICSKTYIKVNGEWQMTNHSQPM